MKECKTVTTSNNLDCFVRPADGGNGARNDETTLVPQYLSALVPSKRAAFTIAEVLITLGIIGVVAAMTMPTLIANHQKQQTATAVKKAYSELSQALKFAEADYGEMKYWDYPEVDNNDVEENRAFVKKYIIPYYKGITMLENGQLEDWPGISISGINFISPNGTLFAGKPKQGVFYVLVDINGFKKPNQEGTDIFYFATTQGKLMPAGWQDGLTREMILEGYMLEVEGDLFTCRANKDDGISFNRHGCTALLMIDGWKFKNDYPWKYNASSAF